MGGKGALSPGHAHAVTWRASAPQPPPHPEGAAHPAGCLRSGEDTCLARGWLVGIYTRGTPPSPHPHEFPRDPPCLGGIPVSPTPEAAALPTALLSLTRRHIPTCMCWSACSTASPRRRSGSVPCPPPSEPPARGPPPLCPQPSPPWPTLPGLLVALAWLCCLSRPGLLCGISQSGRWGGRHSPQAGAATEVGVVSGRGQSCTPSEATPSGFCTWRTPIRPPWVGGQEQAGGGVCG